MLTTGGNVTFFYPGCRAEARLRANPAGGWDVVEVAVRDPKLGRVVVYRGGLWGGTFPSPFAARLAVSQSMNNIATGSRIVP